MTAATQLVFEAIRQTLGRGYSDPAPYELAARRAILALEIASGHPVGEPYPWFVRHALDKAPDFVVGDAADPYLLRWFITPRGDQGGVYLHYFRHDDDDRAPHDHPYDSVSVVLSGEYREHRPDHPPRTIRAGEVVNRPAPYPHRLEVIKRGFTLFIMGPRVREWGFECGGGWRHWTRFVDRENPSAVGPGCEGYTTPEQERQPLPTPGSRPADWVWFTNDGGGQSMYAGPYVANVRQDGNVWRWSISRFGFLDIIGSVPVGDRWPDPQDACKIEVGRVLSRSGLEDPAKIAGQGVHT